MVGSRGLKGSWRGRYRGGHDVGDGLGFAARGALGGYEAGLVKVRAINDDERLSGDEDLKESRSLCPRRPVPGAGER